MTAPIAIIGAGLAGLALAQGLHHHNVPFKVFEKDLPQKRTQGFRFRLGDNGAHALSSLLSEEMWDLFQRTCAEPPTRPFISLKVTDGNEEPWVVPSALDRKGAYLVDRAWLRSLLSMGIETQIVYGKKLVALNIADENARLFFDHGSSEIASLVVGADGIWSFLRRYLLPGYKYLNLQTQVIHGKIVLNEELQKAVQPRPEVQHAIVGQGTACFVCEPMTWKSPISEESSNRLQDISDYLYFALCTPLPPEEHLPRTAEQRKQFVMDTAAGWDSSIQNMLSKLDTNAISQFNTYSSKPESGTWETNTRLTLLGDAAHAMSPSGGMGGTNALQDAADLCKIICTSFKPRLHSPTIGDPETTPDAVWENALRGYEDRMRSRAKEAIEKSFENAKFLWQGKEWWEYHELD